MSGEQLQDEMLKSYINEVFIRYDTDQTNKLNPQQMTNFFNDLFKSLGMNLVISQQQALESIKTIDSNFDGHVDRQ